MLDRDVLKVVQSLVELAEDLGGGADERAAAGLIGGELKWLG